MTTRQRALRRIAVIAGVFLAFVMVGLATGGNEDVDLPLDPTNTRDDGTRAVALLVDELGGDFTRGNAPSDNSVALLLNDDLTQAERDEVSQWVDDGGTLVLADVYSPLAGTVNVVSSTRANRQELEPGCNADVVRGVDRISPAELGRYAMLEPGTGDLTRTACFSSDNSDGHYMLGFDTGFGQTWLLSGSEMFTNARISEQDNAVLVSNLLQLGSGDDVVFLESAGVGAGEQSLADVVPRQAFNVTAQLVVAGLALLLWRWRRFGNPINETPLVEVPASALVVATGDLMQATGRAGRAAGIMQASLRSFLAMRVGLDENSTNADVAASVGQNTGVSAGEVAEVLASRGELTDHELLVLSQKIERIYKRVEKERS